MTIRTRFAPSPTGFLHIGGIRTALFNYLFAKKNGGAFILRLEDTDRERFVPEGVEQIIEGLEWVGLKPDAGFWISEGQHKGIEYVQSERHKAGNYQKWANKLLEQGFAYCSPTSSEELSTMRLEAVKNKQPFLYRKTLDIKNNVHVSDSPIRLNLEAIKDKFGDSVEWKDEIRGDFTDNFDHVEDFIIIKSDGFPTYNFANVIDDHDMNISHVIRGDEFISSTGKHALLYDFFGWKRPKFVHLPVINGTDGKKLSKRTGDTNLLDYRVKGYLPEAMLNFLALLGWNEGTEQEIFKPKELIDKFSLDRVNTSPAIFDPKRLTWVNGHYIRQLTLDELSKSAENYWPKEAKDADEAYKKSVLRLVQERLKYFAELPELTSFFFKDLPVNAELIANHKQLSKLASSQLSSLLTDAKNALEASDFTLDDLSDRLNKLLETTQQKPSVLFSLIRIATTQAPASPGLAGTLAVLGKDRAIKRLQTAVNALAIAQ